jgi:hypothetical protein
MAYEIDIDNEDLFKVLRGRAGGLRPSKPKNNGLYAYVWRWARFHSGADTSMPVTISWDLDDWLVENGHEKIGTFPSDEGKEFLDRLDRLASEVVKHFGGNEYAGALRWGRALGRF